MLDDLKFIHNRDSQDALGVAQKQYEQYCYDFHFDWLPPPHISNVVIAGMGGSGLAAKAAKNWPGLSIPLEVVQDYEIPNYISSTTLFIASSYSGNTEEVVSALEKALALKEKPMIIVMSSGGKLAEMAEKNDISLIKLPSGFQPRMTFGYQLRALCEIFEKTGLASGVVSQLVEAGNWLKEQIKDWEPTVHSDKNKAKQLALDILGKSVVIYSGPKLNPAAYKWKISFNENSKNISWYNVFSEFNHNEIMGWESHPIDKPYTIIELLSDLEHAQNQKRFEITNKVLSGKWPHPEQIKASGDNLIKQLIWLIALGDFVSLYLALLNNIDPTPVELLEEFKKLLQ